ncbi:MAG: hypothetical protein WDZ59_10770 [Pirellulales bacterium]
MDFVTFKLKHNANLITVINRATCDYEVARRLAAESFAEYEPHHNPANFVDGDVFTIGIRKSRDWCRANGRPLALGPS